MPSGTGLSVELQRGSTWLALPPEWSTSCDGEWVQVLSPAEWDLLVN